jgi:hypothetical protein
LIIDVAWIVMFDCCIHDGAFFSSHLWPNKFAKTIRDRMAATGIQIAIATNESPPTAFRARCSSKCGMNDIDPPTKGKVFFLARSNYRHTKAHMNPSVSPEGFSGVSG